MPLRSFLPVAALLSLAAAAQTPLRPQQHTQHAPVAVDYEALFSAPTINGGYLTSSFVDDSWSLMSFGYASPLRCFGSDKETPFDVAIIGAPFDTTTSYRPGARFGPNGIRQGSRRMHIGSINVPYKTRVTDHLNIVDCGDVPMTFVDNKVAIRQLETANADLVLRESSTSFNGTSIAKDGKFHPRVLTLGGDHTITLPLLRGVAKVYGPVSVIHFDSHIDSKHGPYKKDTWKPGTYENGPWLPGEEVPVTHGSYFWYAAQEGLLAPNNSNIHVGIRNALQTWGDYENDYEVGFVISHAEDIEEVGWRGIVKRIREVVGDNPVYITLDIDVIDPGMAPATGTPEIGGFSTREIKQILKGLQGLKIVGADIVEVAPAYDTQAEITMIAAANLGWDILALMAKTPLAE
ncbi:Arginase/deacetylase [Calocera viscosa TUFC12733]|uniref:Arginase/deacetylase n=1 Tax=Calocera viscosa (strain TUFC12733) TaxID=1330018 RepID=A0A167JTR7_CALVF|nr:Arginase/deacetylase [Calocera viscosa TUFC12733]